jgi:GMP synthase (glutamine-hydrolysing)
VKILIIDNNIDQPWGFCGDFRRYLEGEIVVRRGPQSDLPANPGAFTHVILSGSKTSCLDSSPWTLELIDFVQKTAEREIPLLGVSYGHQIIVKAFGGESAVRRSATPEIGWVEIKQERPHALLAGLPERFHTFQSHFEEVARLPSGFIATASSERCAIQAYYVQGRPIFGVQFHPERNAEEGQKSIDNQKKSAPGDCIFFDGQAKSVFTENVARTIFRNFLIQSK